jgi:antitoxin component YwqK of YwqJK toxin-antitoxin module
MELKIKNNTSRIVLEKTDNGIILYDVGDDGVVNSKVVYEIYYKDGIIDFENMVIFISETLESLKIPFVEQETNRMLALGINKIDPDKPSLFDEDFDDDEEDDD